MADEQLTPLQNAVQLIKQLQARLAAQERAQSEPIAVIGMGCRLPGAENPASYWRLLREGRDAVREVPSDRWDIEEYYDPDPSVPGKMNTKWGGFLDGIHDFDADFFGISPREAVRVDPQQRLLLEVAWEALEDAGLAPTSLAHSKTGVYVGVVGSDYGLLQSRDPHDMDVFSGTGISQAILANRLSYVFDLHGPSVTLDTACSSSLVTIHLACQSLRRGESDLALAGGVNLILSPEMTLALTKAYMMAPDGRCKTFDAAANGYVRGEGCGMVVLKRLSDALADGDRILAVIRGSAVNHDGRSNGLSAPNGPAQEAVIRAALADARLSPHDIGYIEAHGTGTRLGDPIEIEALRTVLCEGRPADRPLVVGSVKTNIGHLESAAGIAGLIKLVLMLRHGEIPPHLHLKTLNPLLRLEDGPIEIPTSLRSWPAGSEPRRAGVSSFGFGGTNAHVILEEAPPIAPAADDGRDAPACQTAERPRHVLTLSARSPQALGELAGRYAAYAAMGQEACLADAAYTANTGRTHFAHRAAVVAASWDEAASALRKLAADPDAPRIARGEAPRDAAPRVAFLFTGQGAQYPGMASALYAVHPTFREAIDRCAEILREYLDRPLLELLSAGIGSVLDQTGYTQPVMFAVGYALAQLWRSWGVEPAAVMGHSVGEFAAACIAGVFSLEDGLRLIARRAQLMQSLPSGGVMAAVLAAESRVRPAIASRGGRVEIAALNGPESVVISGDEPAVREAVSQWEREGIQCKFLATSHAFHSHHMDPVLEPLRQAAESINVHPPTIPIVANLTGRLADDRTFADPSYWSRHARSPVRFAEGMKALADEGCQVFLEIGPNPTLIGMGRRCLADGEYAWLPSLRAGRDDWQVLLESLAQLYVRGAPIDWIAFDRPWPRRRVELPTYPFQRKRFIANIVAETAQHGLSGLRQGGPVVHPLLGRRLPAAVREHVFEAHIAANRPATLADHKIQSTVVMPGAAYLEMAMAASSSCFGSVWRVVGASFLEPLLLDKKGRIVQTVVVREGPREASFQILSMKESSPDEPPSFVLHAAGRLEAAEAADRGPIDLAAERALFTGEARDEAWTAEALRKSGLEPGPTFSWTRLHWVEGPEAMAELRGPRETDHADQYFMHPGLLDTAFQVLGAAIPGAGTGIDAFVPIAVDRLQWHGRVEGPAFLRATLTAIDANQATGNLRLVDASGRTLLQAEGVRLRRVPRDWLARLAAGPLPDWCYELAWIPQPLPKAESRSPVEPGAWLIFDSRDGLGRGVAELLEQAGHRCRVVPAAGDSASRQAAVQEFLAAAERDARGVVYLGALDVDATADGPDFQTAREVGWGGLLDVVHALTQQGRATLPRLWAVTRGAQPIADCPTPLSLAQSPLWGLGRVIATEHPELSCTRIDLDPRQTEAMPATPETARSTQGRGGVDQLETESAGPRPTRLAAEQLAEELTSNADEDQVAYRGSERRVARLRRMRQAIGGLEVPQGQPYRLEITSRGQLDNVALRPMVRQTPGPGQIEIKVRASGLNFRDVLNLLNLYPGDPGPLGGECAGEVVAVGPGVEHFRPGDEVLALAPASFASYATTLAAFAALKPKRLSFDEAATIPICFLTAHLALRRLGKMRPGERVLIHAASGGVGLAAIQIARRVGAEIFATAGSPKKREYLKSLGIQHVMDSRSTQFARQIQEATGGEGIDLVVNSLTGESIAASLSVLRAGGRFLELGKTDLWDQQRVDAFRPGVVFHAIALDRMMAEEPETVDQLMREVMAEFAAGNLDPLPLRSYPIPRVVDALRLMARAEHIGKVVIQSVETADARDAGLTLREDASYLVTGGLGGLGLKLARWLVDRGAKHLVLTSRSAPSDDARRVVEELEKSGAKIGVRACDVGNRAEVAALLASLREGFPPLRGIFHLAGVLDDGVLREQNRQRFDRVMASKVLGAWNLHALTQDQPLDLFVLFSSAAALLGSPGQGNYAAANAFLDALAAWRRWQGQPGLSINWGSWAEAGMAARLKDAEGRRWSATGFGWIDPAQGLRTMEQLLVEGRIQAGVLPVDWPKFFERIPAGSEPAWLTEMARGARAGAVESGPPALLQTLQNATASERIPLALAHVRQAAAEVLAMGEGELPDPRRPLNELGFDSLTGVEFCNRVGRSIGEHLNPTVLFDHPTLEGLATHVVRDMLRLETDAQPAAAPQETAAETAEDQAREQALAEVEAMTEDEIEALVEAQLEKLGQ